MNQLGKNVSNTIYLKGPESHKLHQAFTVATDASVMVGQPVKLNAEGQVLPAEASDNPKNIIGYSVHRGTEGDEVTIAMKAYALIYVKPKAAVEAGPVKYDGVNTADKDYISVAAAGSGDHFGWCLEPTTSANEQTLIAVI